MFALQNELLMDWYAYCADRHIEFQPKPTGPGAFPSAADRAELDKQLAVDNNPAGQGGIPAIAEPKET